MAKNIFDYYGSSIYDVKLLKILRESKFDGFRVIANELLTDGTIHSTPSKTSRMFVHGKTLYYFLASQSSQISSFFELNTNKDACIDGSYGVYYEVYQYKT